MNEIQSVKIQGDSYNLTMVDGRVFQSVPKINSNIEYELIKQWLAEGNAPEPEFTESELLANAKELKRNQIRNDFLAESEAPVLVGTVTYHGGFDSAIKLDAVRRLAESIGATEVTFYDVDNTGHILSLVDAQNVITVLGAKYQNDFSVKQARMVAVENALDISQVEVV